MQAHRGDEQGGPVLIPASSQRDTSVSRSKRSAALLVVGAVSLVLMLSGCTSSDGLAHSYAGGAGYVSGDGGILELAPDQRKVPISFSGPTDDGTVFDSSALTDHVAVVNFWYAGCPPCRVEAPILAELSAQLSDVRFLGINVSDEADVVRTFDEKNGINYPSLLAVQSDTLLLSFSGFVPPSATPTTLVLDRQGRVAARILGEIEDASILDAIVQRVESEG